MTCRCVKWVCDMWLGVMWMCEVGVWCVKWVGDMWVGDMWVGEEGV